MPLQLAFNKNRLKPNATLTAQLNKSVNGTTSGNLAFLVNNPKAAYKWQNSLTRVLISKKPSKTVQWQFGKGALAQQQAGNASQPTAGGGSGGGGGGSSTPASNNNNQSSSTNTEGESTAALNRPPASPVRGTTNLSQASPLPSSVPTAAPTPVGSSVEFASSDYLAVTKSNRG